MRAYLYMFVHSLIGGIVKLFRKAIIWIILLSLMIMVVFSVSFGVVGGAVGFMLANSSISNPGEEEVDDNHQEEVEDDEEKTQEEEEDYFARLTKKYDLNTIKQFLEAVAFMAIVGLTMLFIYTGLKKGVNLFSMADINFLFTSPLKPQANLLYRMLGTMITYLIMGIYFGIVWPISFMGLGLKYYQIASCALVYVILLAGGQMISILSYMISSSKEGLKEKIRTGIFVIIGVVGAGFLYLVKVKGMDYVDALIAMFGNRFLNFLPYFGWLKAVIAMAMYHRFVMIFVFATLSILAVVAVFILALRYPADFYEDAFEYAEKMMQTQATANSGRMTEVQTRKKARGKLYRRGQIGHGKFASVMFFKQLYLRKRLALFGIFSLEMVLWAGVLGAASYLLRGQANIVMYGFIIGVTLYEMFRNFGNPIAVDMERPFIYLMPDTPFRKLAFAMLGNLVAFVIDVTPAIILMCILSRMNVLQAIGCFIFLLGINFFFGGTGLMIGMMIPESIPDKLRTYIQSMLKMLPMLPIILVISGAVFIKMVIPAIYLCGLLGIGLGFACIGISAAFMQRNR